MKGSEKQIRWAEDLKESALRTFEAAKENDPTEAGKAVYGQLIDALNGAESARDIISIYKDIRFTGDWKQDILKIAGVYRAYKPITDGERKIMCK